MLAATKRGKSHSSWFDDEVMIAAAKGPTSILHDPKPPPLGPVCGSEFLEPDHAVSDTMDRFVQGVGGQIVQQDHRHAPLCKVMLESQNLPPVPQRTLREETDLERLVQDHQTRRVAIDGGEDLSRSFTQLKVR